jgi:hypothetical protein
MPDAILDINRQKYVAYEVRRIGLDRPPKASKSSKHRNLGTFFLQSAGFVREKWYHQPRR